MNANENKTATSFVKIEITCAGPNGILPLLPVTLGLGVRTSGPQNHWESNPKANLSYSLISAR